MQVRHRAVITGLALGLALGLASCAGIAPFSSVAYEQGTSLKVDALSLMDHAIDPYPTHAAETEALMLRVEKAYEYAKGRPKNTFTEKQWVLLKDRNGHLLGGFVVQWHDKGTLSAAFVEEAKGNVAMAFDAINQFESGKNHADNSK